MGLLWVLILNLYPQVMDIPKKTIYFECGAHFHDKKMGIGMDGAQFMTFSESITNNGLRDLL
jgi:hypothetical protein